MLLNLNIKNLAVFEDISISFDNGFNVITGETGAGKSILIDALFLLIGYRASKELIRNGNKKAYISAAFDITDNLNVLDYLNQNNILIEEDDYLIISREILNSGKSINKINNNIVSISILKELGVFLLDIYGQFEQQYIYKKENHIVLLDNLASGELANELSEYESLYKEYRHKLLKVREIEDKLINKDSKIEQYTYEINEIEEAILKEDEEDNLIRELKKISNIKEIKTNLYEIEGNLTQNDSSAINIINHSYSLLTKISNFDDHINEYLQKLDIIIDELQDLTFNIINYSESLDIDEEKLDEIDKRISLINRLKRKYGFSIIKIFEYKDELKKEYTILLEADNKLSKLNKELEIIKSKLAEKASIITKARQKIAEYIEKNIVKELDDLNMKNAKFKVNIITKSDFSINGVDDIEFLMCTNSGSNFNSIQKIVSGGEASRIMLAFKKLGSDNLYKSTLIFDEIDTGISGKTAQMAGNKMKFISKNTQVICITHSPQIASISETHFMIEKNNVLDKTVSHIKKLHNDEKINEVARLLSGMNITVKSLNNAKELIEESNK
ncbi:DNA repair protein RecN [Sedimentibacter sp. zth1]|uniref:DNA repair protein RecN n=1 Tax=Sedimentibacter sp. zth1 TaxID=2816908 RepID=UPI001A91C928|nr:DNA repair protein RecN [Sedimentibacter sp. zth1]QSX06812.1 DNA repair protein RecN [Sedimentibacter sp. zth1]